ncbi:hypothetical protein [Pseudofrankia asymbiotica]|uniref:Uncharacterized protein n=1 Tax=Pseudofrankia asymbiotica TaxID=1834516 RepID=A0A1V2I986_9ACTN|nr:hypothetical protein [Pseudofrankia asymbiotica]ONH29123.1 hypothetical protein BL253_17035 [Pseudofrankia asymbiotica]
MKSSEFWPYADRLILEAACPPITKIETFEACGYVDKPWGHRLTFDTGSTAYVMWVFANPVGMARAPEGEPLAPVDLPSLAPSGNGYLVRDIEGWIAAVLVNGGSSQVKQVRRYSLGETSSTFYKVGLSVDFYSGAHACGMFVHTLRSGDQPMAHREHQVAERI